MKKFIILFYFLLNLKNTDPEEVRAGEAKLVLLYDKEEKFFTL